MNQLEARGASTSEASPPSSLMPLWGCQTIHPIPTHSELPPLITTMERLRGRSPLRQENLYQVPAGLQEWH